MESLKKLVKINYEISDLSCDGDQACGLNINKKEEQDAEVALDQLLTLMGNNEQYEREDIETLKL